jgi:hypothetical protein
MKIEDLFRELSLGELSNLAISNEGSGEIAVNKQPQMIQYVNDALVQLYSRFVLNEKELLIEQVENITQYHLRLRYTESAGDVGYDHYIKDTGNPFPNDLIRILAVWDANGCKLPLNDSADCDSLFTPMPDTLQVPTPSAGDILSVVYQARAPKLSDRVDDGEIELLQQEFELPVIFENALKQYVTHKVFFHMGGQENVVKASGYLNAYEADCALVEQRDLANQTVHTSHTKLEQRGFV